ncbi:hypothetical protein AGMMS50262_01820 [Bacteroidia bacterium]|nr:hypothetical protein AGMMS50262_01820 [Bacteroidia bacterium]
MRRMKKTMILALLMLVVSAGLKMYAQVTVGSESLPQEFSLLELDTQYNKRGLRLPQISSAQRDSITQTTVFQNQKIDKGRGLTIFNTDTKCLEYWNGTRWVSICTGTANIDLTPTPPTPGAIPDTIPAIGGGPYGPIIPEDHPRPDCGTSIPYSVLIVSGSEFTHLTILDPATGAFEVSFDANNTAVTRTAVIRVVNNCTTEYKDFYIPQKGDASVCGTYSTNPVVAANTTPITLCANGSVYLYVTNVAAVIGSDDENNLVWSRGGVEIGRGISYTATTPGSYRVYAGGIGCTCASNNIVVEASTSTAPDAIVTIDAQNAGVLCGGAGTLTLTAYPTTSLSGGESIEWYRDGVHVGTGATLSVGPTDLGHSFFAVRKNGDCYSKQSNVIVPVAGTGSDPNPSASDFYVNGVAMNGTITICPNTVLLLTVQNTNPSYTYTWSVNGVALTGSSSSASYTVPFDATLCVISCVVSGSGVCSKSVTVNAMLNVAQPVTPTIAAGPSLLCSGTTLMLTASPDATTGLVYLWYKDGVLVKTSANNTDNTYTVTAGGTYTVQTQISSCLSSLSAGRTITLASQPTNLQFTVAPAIVNPGVDAVFTITATNASGYDWAATGTPTITKTGASATINWTTPGPYVVTATASNDCGSAQVTANVTIQTNQMTTPVVLNTAGTCGNGILFYIQTPYADMADASNFAWTVTAPAGVTGTALGNKGEQFFVPYTSTNSTAYTVSVIANGSKLASAAATGTFTGAANASSNFFINGSDCYDIKQTQYDPAVVQWGLWANRVRLTANSNYAYSVGGTGTVTSYVWSVSDPDGILTAASVSSVNANTTQGINIQFKPDVLTDAWLINQPANERKVVLMCVVTTSGGCVYIVTKQIRVGDRDCCTGLSDYEGTTYTTYRFGTAGCWMTENLATTYNMKKGVQLTDNNSTSNDPHYTTQKVNNTGTKMSLSDVRNSNYFGNNEGKVGVFYNWAAAVGAANGTAAQNTTTYPNMTGTTTANGPSNANTVNEDICPTGWHLPSDAEWSLLEKEISANYTQYSTSSTASTWTEVSGTYRGTHGTMMRSKTPATLNGYIQNPVGTSNVKEKGFSVLLVGYAGSGTWANYGFYTYYWSSSSNSDTSAWRRYLNYGTAGVARGITLKASLWSVRCKKNE